PSRTFCSRAGVLFATGHRDAGGGSLVQTREQGTVMRPTDSEWGSSRDRGTIITGAALIGVAGVAWVGVVLQGMSMKEGAGAYDLISLSGGFAFLAAWVVMMAAMMLAGAHAAYCIGCCSALMVVLVAAGAMSLPWVLLIALIVFIEKLLPRGDFVARMVGVGFVVLGLAVAIDPELAATLRGTAMSS